MKHITDSEDKDEIGDIMRQQIFAAWRTGEIPANIAEVMGIPVGDVYKSLKQAQKELVKGWS